MSRALAATIAACALLVSCGDDRPPAPPAAATASTSPVAPRARAEPPQEVGQAEIDELLGKWRRGRHGDDEDAATVADRMDAAGAATLDRLFASLTPEDWFRARQCCVISRIGPRAIPHLLAALGSADAEIRVAAMDLLARMAGTWAYDAEGPAVCRALLVHLDDEIDRDWAVRALAVSRPAGREIVQELADRWAGGASAASAAEVLAAVGTDAAPVARPALAVLRGADAERRTQAIKILAAIGAADPSLLADLRAALSDERPQVRAGALGVLSAWGEVAAPAAQQIAALLKDPDEDVRGAAAGALGSMPSAALPLWRDVVASAAPGWDEVLLRLGRMPAFLDRLERALPSLSADELDSVFAALRNDDRFDGTAFAPALARHPTSEGRRLAIELSLSNRATHGVTPVTLPEGVGALLGDSDPGVRAYAARAFAENRGAPDDRIREAATALLDSTDEDARDDALRALEDLSDRDPTAAATVKAFEASHPQPAAPDPPAAAALAASLFAENSRFHDQLGELLRLKDGETALADAIRRQLAVEKELRRPGRAPDGATHQDSSRLDLVVDAVVRAGPRAASVRDALTDLRGSAGSSDSESIDRALAAIDAEPDAIARAGPWCDEATVRRLMEFGEPGLRGVVLLVGTHLAFAPDVATWLGDTPMSAAVTDCAKASGTSDDAVHRRIGAAKLARNLPPADAVALLRLLVTDADEDVRTESVRTLGVVEERTPGSVPVALAAVALASSSGSALPNAEYLASLLADRGAVLVPRLRELRDAGTLQLRAYAAVALWRITHREDEALPTLRAILARPEKVDGLSWSFVGKALGETRLGDDDVAALVTTIRYAANLDSAVGDDPAPMSGGDSPQVGSQDVRGSLRGLVPALEPLGARAASAVSALRIVVARSVGEGLGDPDAGRDAVRVLGAIGPAAREAIPDLRRWAAANGDPVGLARAALAKIEAAPR